MEIDNENAIFETRAQKKREAQAMSQRILAKTKENIFKIDHTCPSLFFKEFMAEIRFEIYEHLSNLEQYSILMCVSKTSHNDLKSFLSSRFDVFRLLPFSLHFSEHIATLISGNISCFVNAIAVFPQDIAVVEEGPVGIMHMHGDTRVDLFDVLKDREKKNKEWYKSLFSQKSGIIDDDYENEDYLFVYSGKVPEKLIDNSEWKFEKRTNRYWQELFAQNHILVFPSQKDGRFHAELVFPRLNNYAKYAEISNRQFEVLNSSRLENETVAQKGCYLHLISEGGAPEQKLSIAHIPAIINLGNDQYELIISTLEGIKHIRIPDEFDLDDCTDESIVDLFQPNREKLFMAWDNPIMLAITQEGHSPFRYFKETYGDVADWYANSSKDHPAPDYLHLLGCMQICLAARPDDMGMIEKKSIVHQWCEEAYGEYYAHVKDRMHERFKEQIAAIKSGEGWLRERDLYCLNANSITIKDEAIEAAGLSFLECQKSYALLKLLGKKDQRTFWQYDIRIIEKKEVTHRWCAEIYGEACWEESYCKMELGHKFNFERAIKAMELRTIEYQKSCELLEELKAIGQGYFSSERQNLLRQQYKMLYDDCNWLDMQYYPPIHKNFYREDEDFSKMIYSHFKMPIYDYFKKLIASLNTQDMILNQKKLVFSNTEERIDALNANKLQLVQWHYDLAKRITEKGDNLNPASPNFGTAIPLLKQAEEVVKGLAGEVPEQLRQKISSEDVKPPLAHRTNF